MLKKYILCLNYYYNNNVSIPYVLNIQRVSKNNQKLELTQNITTQKSPWIEGKYMVATQ